MKIEPNYIKVTLPDDTQVFVFTKKTQKPKEYTNRDAALADIENLKKIYNNPHIKFEITDSLKFELTYMQKIKRFFGKNKNRNHGKK